MADEQGARYDRIADGYARHWGAVIEPAAVRLLDDLTPMLPAGSTHVLDIGTGTGALAIAALERWPRTRVTGIDPSAVMTAHAMADAERRLQGGAKGRLQTATAFADRLPFPDGTFDLAMSSFVLQLVPSRAAALREAKRVLRPGAPLGYVTWLRGDGAVDPPDRVFEEVLAEFDFDPPTPDGPSKDPVSVSAAANGLRHAGFRDVRARADELVHRWTPRTYLAFLEGFSEETLFDELVERERRALRRRLLERLGKLAPADLRLRLPVVYVTGRASG